MIWCRSKKLIKASAKADRPLRWMLELYGRLSRIESGEFDPKDCPVECDEWEVFDAMMEMQSAIVRALRPRRTGDLAKWDFEHEMKRSLYGEALDQLIEAAARDNWQDIEDVEGYLEATSDIAFDGRKLQRVIKANLDGHGLIEWMEKHLDWDEEKAPIVETHVAPRENNQAVNAPNSKEESR